MDRRVRRRIRWGRPSRSRTGADAGCSVWEVTNVVEMGRKT